VVAVPAVAVAGASGGGGVAPDGAVPGAVVSVTAPGGPGGVPGARAGGAAGAVVVVELAGLANEATVPASVLPIAIFRSCPSQA